MLIPSLSYPEWRDNNASPHSPCPQDMKRLRLGGRTRKVKDDDDDVPAPPPASRYHPPIRILAGESDTNNDSSGGRSSSPMTLNNNLSSPITISTSPPSERYRYALTAFNNALPPGSSSGGGDVNDGGLRSRHRQRSPPVASSAATSANDAEGGWSVSIGENYKYNDAEEEDGTIFSDGGGAYNNKQRQQQQGENDREQNWEPFEPNYELQWSQQQNMNDGEDNDDNSNSTSDTHQQQQSLSFRARSLLDDVGEEGEEEKIGVSKSAFIGEGIERRRSISFQEQQRLHGILSSGRSSSRRVTNNNSRMSNNNHNNNIHNDDDDGYSCDVDINSSEGGGGERGNIQQLLQPDAIYEERYGDAYVDQSIKYLYPAGYQSMRPRSGPWRLSVLIFIIFACLNIFVVGHCYDRGVRDYYNNNSGRSSSSGMVDDEYLQDVDDDSLLMETRWCGSRPLYFMWLVSVWITVSSSSYCCIIGYVKMRDFVVANGRSQPAGMGGWGNIGKGGGRSDYYYLDSGLVGEKDRKNEVGSSGSGRAGVTASIPQAAYATVAPSTVGSDTGTTTTTSAYSSYQGSGGRYVQSIYQSDGTPQFWGGHIYRPTQAAVAMTNRP